MSKVKSTSVEVRLPSQLGYEKVAMSTAAARTPNKAKRLGASGTRPKTSF